MADPDPGVPPGRVPEPWTSWDVAGRTSDPRRALDKLLERDALFTDRLAAEADALGLQRIVVDSSLTKDDLARRVSDLFGL